MNALRPCLPLLALSFSCGDTPCAPAKGGEACPLDPCAEVCLSVEAAAQCCIDKHGYGLKEDDPLYRSIETCTDECDPERVISAEAAVCIAQAYGLHTDLESCEAQIEANSTYAPQPARWFVFSFGAECPYDGVILDGYSGEVLGEHDYPCPENGP